ncbi:MAG: hypothetical protein ACE5PV_10085 [Candidatus Poribacteria bacterium]
MKKYVCSILVAYLVLFAGVGLAQVIETELAGNSLPWYPHFEYVRAFNEDATVEVAVDPTRFSDIVGVTADIYVVQSQSSWTIGDPLVDAGSGFETHTFVDSSIKDNRVLVASGGELDSDAGIDLGVPYDVVIDIDQNGVLSDGDFLDSKPDEVGFYVMKDLVAKGPLAVKNLDYSVTGVTPGYTRERTWFPIGISVMGKLPLVIISHGNGHNYQWYDYLQEHLASYGYIVMSHQNNTGPGIETASTTTLEHTDAILGQQGSIGGGVLDGHIDSSRITWIGHSRGGEGVARAYDRIFDGAWTPVNYSLDDIVLISSIAPTDFLGPDSSDPHGVNYHFLYGSADGDVCGCPDNDIAQAFHILERATGFRQSTYVHGADHNDFNCCGFDDFTGPPGTAIGREEAQRVAKAVYLALVKHYVNGNIPAKDYLWRQYERFKPIGVSPDTVVVSEYKEGPDSGKFVIDDYQSQSSLWKSSSGGRVIRYRVSDLQEGLLDDNNTNFTWVTSDPFNGMTRARFNDSTRGLVFSVSPDDGNGFIQWQIIPEASDFSQFKYLSFRACQGTRHPLTTAKLSDVNWAVLLVDGNSNSSFINFSAYGGGIEEPYQRTGYGSGAGWQNEFETIRIRLNDFLTNRPDFDLTNIKSVTFIFSHILTERPARLGLDDLELTED